MLDRDNRIMLLNGEQSRWKCEDHFTRGHLRYLRLVDCHPDIVEPMQRRVLGITLHCESNLQIFQIEALKKQFEAACKAMSASFSGLPEPLDFLFVNNGIDQLPDAVAGCWPIIILTVTPGKEPHSLMPGFVKHQCKGNLIGPLTKFYGSLVSTLRELSVQEKVLRQLPLSAICVTHPVQYVINDPFSICEQGGSGYSHDIPFLNLKKKYSAPECFQPDGELTPATDVYVLAKTLLAFLGIHWTDSDPFPTDITPLLATVEKRYGFSLPPHIITYFKLSLTTDPRLRFQNVGQAINALRNKAGKIIAARITGVVTYYNHQQKYGTISSGGKKHKFRRDSLVIGESSQLGDNAEVRFDIEENAADSKQFVKNIHIVQPSPEQRCTGEIYALPRGRPFGFIKSSVSGQENIFFHFDALPRGGQHRISKGTMLEFYTQNSRRGLQAKHITFLSRGR